MANIACAISGIKFTCSHLEDTYIPHTAGYFHPIFAIPYKSLHHLYSQYCKGQLAPNDSYLLFLAFLHATDQVTWDSPATLDPASASTIGMIANNLGQLVRVLEKTDCISHPSFTQPSFRVTYDTSTLHQIPNWISAWQENIERFLSGRIDKRTQESLQKVENKLTYLILSGDKPETYAGVIAAWADQAAEFPPHHRELWIKTISSCFNITKMFNTPLPLLKEIKNYCECNIEVGSIHFHTLSHVLKEGIHRHIDYLGGSSLALGYTLLPTSADQKERELKGAAEVATIVARATELPPVRSAYTSSLDFLKAKLAYKVATIEAARALT